MMFDKVFLWRTMINDLRIVMKYIFLFDTGVHHSPLHAKERLGLVYSVLGIGSTHWLYLLCTVFHPAFPENFCGYDIFHSTLLELSCTLLQDDSPNSPQCFVIYTNWLLVVCCLKKNCFYKTTCRRMHAFLDN